MIWLVIWTVLMILWGLSSLYIPPSGTSHPYPWASPLLAWGCVLILGLVLFGAVSVR